MRTAIRITAAAAFAVLGSCANGAERGAFCVSDDECRSAGMVCFVDGCGDPGKDIVVEVVPGASSGQLAQDFAIENLQPVQDINAFEPAVIVGVLQQDVVNAQPMAYLKDVLFRAYGKSTVIPGRSRSVQYTIVPESGAFEVAMPTGLFSVSMTPLEELDLPPQGMTGVVIQPGQAVNLNFDFPSIEGRQPIHGKILKSAMSPEVVKEAVLEIQALDPADQTPLSQRTRVSSGQEGSTGDFTLYIEDRDDLSRIFLRVAPQDPTAAVPSKTFDVAITDEVRAGVFWELGDLYLGDFGTAVAATGRLVDPAAQPVAGATVYVEGFVQGGGTFRSQVTTTALDGTFSVQSLPSASGQTLNLLAVPTPKALAGVVRKQITIPAGGVALGDVKAPEKVEVVGRIMDPKGQNPVPGVLIEVEPFSVPSSLPLPTGVTRTASDADGKYVLRLDPAVYRIDFLPSDLRPRVSRFITVEGAPDPNGKRPRVDLPEFWLSNGRRVTGTIFSIPRRLSTPTPVPAPYASVKFFRIADIDGVKSSVLLAEGVADSRGNYSVVLPAATE